MFNLGEPNSDGIVLLLLGSSSDAGGLARSE